MRPSAGNSGQYDSNQSLNKPRVTDQKTYLPMRSSAQVFAQQNAQDSSLKRTATPNSQNFSSSSFSSTKRGFSFDRGAFPTRTHRAGHRLNSNQKFSYNPDSSGTRKQRSISPTGALPFNPNAGANRYQTDRFFPKATASKYDSQGFGPQTYNPQGYGPQGAYAYSDSHGAPSAAVAIPRPARIPAGYLPYTQTSKMGKSEQAAAASETPSSSHRSQPPITSLDDDFPADSGGSAMAPDIYPPDFDQDVAGAGAGTEASPLEKKRKADDPQKDRFRKNLKYGEYLSVPQGKKAIFTDNGGSHTKTLLWMGIILVVLLVAAIAVWSFV